MENIKECFVEAAQEERRRDTVEDRSSTIMRRRIRSEGGITKGRGKKNKKAQRGGRERQGDHSQKEWFGLLTILRKMFIKYTEMI